MEKFGCTPKKMLGIGKKLFSMYKDHAASNGGAPPATSSRDAADILGKMAAAVTGDNKWKLTNIGGIGSDEDKELRQKAAQSEAQFDGAGETPGIEIWRVEKFEPARQEPRVGNLSLYSGDCYIILKTTKKPDSDALDWQLHYWIGKDSTQDESGSAAYFTVNIDDLLNQKVSSWRTFSLVCSFRSSLSSALPSNFTFPLFAGVSSCVACPTSRSAIQ